jgi:hypothetical protein
LQSSTDKVTIPEPATGLLVYNTNASMTNGFGAGFYYNSSTPANPVWMRITTGGSTLQSWVLTGNSGTNSNTDFIGTRDLSPLVFRTNNVQSGRLDPFLRNYFFGQNAGIANTTGQNNVAYGQNALRLNTTKSGLVAIGTEALENNGTSATSSTQAIQNTAVGHQALRANTTGSYNTAVGHASMLSNTTGNSNTALGANALRSNVDGQHNSAMGFGSLRSNTSGSNNTAMGTDALSANTTGQSNTALGTNALSLNTTGNNNTGLGFGALSSNTTGSDNVGIGSRAYMQSANGNRNTAVGYQAMEGTITGNSNDGVAIGFNALRAKGAGNNNTAVGTEALENATGAGNVGIGYRAGRAITTGTNNTAVGNGASISATVSNSTAIGNGASVTASNTVRVGNNLVISIGGQVAWTSLSDGRAKKDVSDNVPGLPFIMGLRPVSYYIDAAAAERLSGVAEGKYTAQSEGLPQVRHTGFIAQEVAALVKQQGVPFDGVDVPKDGNGPLGLRYAIFVVPLVKAVQTQQTQIESMKNKVQILQEQVQEELHRLKQKAQVMPNTQL